jgi:prophage tail gpP-like protein
MPNPAEVATLVVGGRRFDDWQSVWVQSRYAEAYPLFRFTAAERDPIPELWTKLQFKPGDECAIYLGGQLGVAGVIEIRQVAYDANNHAVQLSGRGLTSYASRSSVIHKTGNFDGKTFEQVGREVIAPYGVGIKVIGTLNAIPFKRLQVQPGELVWDFLERIARPRGIILGSDVQGNFLFIDHHIGTVVEQLVEGQNILRCQCIISSEHTFTNYMVRGQTAASDDQHGTDASEQECSVGGTARHVSILLTPAEQPVWNKGEVCDRAKNEAIWHEGTIINANITVQGWLRSGQALWHAGDDVHVKSPMAMLNQILKIQTATFTQDRDSGTLTTLELVAPWLLKDGINYDVGRPGVPQAPGEGKSTGGSGVDDPQAPATVAVPSPPPLTLEE